MKNTKWNENEIRFEVEELNGACEPDAIEEPKKGGLRQFVRKNGVKIIVGTYYVLMAAATVGGIVKGARNQKKFDLLIKQKYGENTVEGKFAEGNLKRLWEGNRAFEESYKGNFDKVADFVKDLDMRADEGYTINRVVDKSGKIVTELMQIRDEGWYHGQIL